MTIHLGYVPAGSTLYIPFMSYDSDGASVTLSGLAVTDVEIYRNGSTTQRASDNGYALLDTDGIDFDGVTGLNGFSIDLSDNSDAGFYVAGSQYWVVVSSVTIDGQTVNVLAATFRIGPVEANVTQNAGTAITSASGRQEVNVSHIAGSAVSTSSAQLGVNVVNAAGTAWGSGAITAGVIAADAIGASELAADAATEIATAVWASGTRALTVLDEDSTTLDLDATIRAAVGLASANLDTQLAAIDDAVDTEVAAIAAALTAAQVTLDELQSGIIYGEAAAGTLSTTQATTDLTGYADDQLIGRVIVWLSGDCEGEASDITDYASASGLLTFTALTTAPADTDAFKIV